MLAPMRNQGHRSPCKVLVMRRAYQSCISRILGNAAHGETAGVKAANERPIRFIGILCSFAALTLADCAGAQRLVIFAAVYQLPVPIARRSAVISPPRCRRNLNCTSSHRGQMISDWTCMLCFPPWLAPWPKPATASRPESR